MNSDKLRLLIIQQAPDWGGAEEWMANLVKVLSKKVGSITGYTNLQLLKDSWNKSGVNTYNLPYVLDIIGDWKGLIKTILIFPFAFFWYAKILYLVKKRGINLIVMSGFTEKLLVSWLSKLVNIPVIWFEYGPLDFVFSKNFHLPKVCYRATKDIPEKIITISQNSKNKLILATGLPLSKLKVIYPGVTIPRRTSNLKNPVVGSLSRLAIEKGQRQLVESWPGVVKKIPNARLIIAGRGPDERYLKQLINQLGIEKSVKMLGFIKNKNQFYEDLSVFVFPSNWEMEGFGIVAAEAMAHGVPVIGNLHGPVPEIVSNSTGKLIKSGETKQLTEAIVGLLKNLNLRKKMGTQGRKKAIERFNLNKQADKILNEMYEVVKETR